MLKHYIKIIYRGFARYKTTFLINLIGLSTGLACVLLIYLWVNDELNFDKFNDKDNRLFQVMANHNNSGKIITLEATPDLLAETIAQELPEIEMASAILPIKIFGKLSISVGTNNFNADGEFAGKDFFKMFSYELLQGNNNALAEKNSICLSEKLAYKLFSTTDNIIGRSVEWHWMEMNIPVTVTGIFKDTPRNSSSQFEFLLPFEAWKELSAKLGRGINWDNHAPSTYILLKKEADINQVNKKIAGFIKSKYSNSLVTLFTRKYSDGYLYGKYEEGKLTGGRIEYVRIFSVIAAFILIIACINFMNLSTARASRRLKEVGIKKAIGSDRKKLILQFITESIAVTFLASLLALLISIILIPRFNLITGKELTLSLDYHYVTLFIIITFITGILAGSYPAVYLSRLKPINVLKNFSDSSKREILTRKGLVIFQFTLSTVFIISVLIVNEQIRFIQTKNPGYDKNNIIYFTKEGNAAKKYDAFLTELKKMPGVSNASIIISTITGSKSATAGIGWEGKSPDEVIYFEEIFIGYDMIETLGIKMKEGRSFSKNFGDEESKIIFNETAIKLIGYKDPLGKKVGHYSGQKEIIGIVKDFNFESLHQTVKPLLFRIAPQYTTKFMVKINSGKEKETINNIRALYGKFNPGFEFDYKFLDEDYQSQYISEKRVEILSKYFAALAIIISCLGLFGLSSFTAEKRIKEIGIRKVLGANISGIVILLSKDFIKLIVISLLLAVPAAWYISGKWLQDFAYHINITLWIFLISGAIVVFIALGTISFEAIKAATANPVKALKYE